MSMVIEVGPYFFGIAILIVYSVIFWPFMILFIHYRNEELIKSRGWILSVLSCFAGYIISVISLIDSFYTKCYIQLLCSLTYFPLICFPYFYRSFLLWAQSKYNKVMLRQYQDSDAESFQTQASLMKKYSWSTYPISQVIAFIITLVIFTIMSFPIYYLDEWVLTPEMKQTQHLLNARCATKNQTLIISFQFVILFVGVVTSIIANWKVRDNLLFKTELKFALVTGVVFFTPWLIFRFVKPNLYFRGTIISTTAAMGCFCVTIILPVITFMKRRKMTSDEKKMSSLNVIDMILSDKEHAASFEKFVSEMWCTENLFFYKFVKKYEKTHDVVKRKQEAQKIWRNFFAEDAPLEINIDSPIRKQVLEQINSGNVPIDLFQGPKDTVLNMLQFSVFPLWRNKYGYQPTMVTYSEKDDEKIDILHV